MTKRIISVSRRTDVPAFYGEWFMNRIRAGFAGHLNPFGGQKYLVSLKPEDVACFVFWSKNYTPFLRHLEPLRDMGYPFYFNFTITGLPHAFECNLVDAAEAVETLKRMSAVFSPARINWRYDPIVISDATPVDFHRERFADLARRLRGCVTRCYFSFALRYGKVQRNFERFSREKGVEFRDLEAAEQLALAHELARVANANGMELFTCCGDHLLGPAIRKAHCIDGDLIRRLFFREGLSYRELPTRKQCGCTESTDIGAYDTCPHGCVYCYANVNKERAGRLHAAHDPSSPFLGVPREEGERWVGDILATQEADAKVPQSAQMSLF